jgi:hypothetical protein
MIHQCLFRREVDTAAGAANPRNSADLLWLMRELPARVSSLDGRL